MLCLHEPPPSGDLISLSLLDDVVSLVFVAIEAQTYVLDKSELCCFLGSDQTPCLKYIDYCLLWGCLTQLVDVEAKLLDKGHGLLLHSNNALDTR